MRTPAKYIKFVSTFIMCFAFVHAQAVIEKATAPAAETSNASNATGDTGSDAAALAELEKSIRDMMELDKFKTISYHDEKGAVLTSDQFYKLVAAGWSFETIKKLTGNVPTSAVLSLKSKDAISDKSSTTYKIKRGDQFPGFRLKQVDGHLIDNKQLSGHYSLINFYFSQCSPCVKEIPDLNALAAKHQDMNFIAITFDPASDTRQFMEERKFEWKVVPDAKKLIKKLGVQMFPSFALLDPNGVVLGIAERSEINASDNNLESWVARLVANPTLN
jgi:peroxiredoxin